MPDLHDYQPGELVDVRSAVPTWWPGVVSLVDDAKIVVDMDAPQPTGNQWSGQTLRYGGSSPVLKVTIWKASESVLPPEDAHIRMRP